MMALMHRFQGSAGVCPVNVREDCGALWVIQVVVSIHLDCIFVYQKCVMKM